MAVTRLARKPLSRLLRKLHMLYHLWPEEVIQTALGKPNGTVYL